MEAFCNVQTFANNYDIDEKIPKELTKLWLFTFHSKLERTMNSRLTFSDIVATNDTIWNQYIFKYNSKEYPFSVFSDNDLQKFDKKVLKSTKRMQASIFRSLKLACSMDLVNPRIVIGNSIDGIFDLLIVFQERGTDKVIDYARNLIMSKEDYYEIFKFHELNVVDKMDLYNIYYIINEFDDYEHIYEYLIFAKEIFAELSKKEDFSFLVEKYDRNGINRHNYLLFGNDCDCLFFQSTDVHHMKYDKLIREIDNFTENPMEKQRHITYVEDKKKYRLWARSFGYFTFDLLSNLIPDEGVKKILLSTDRYGECHVNANKLAMSLSESDKASAYIVGGKFKENENDYFFHSWIEIDDKNVVIDFNHNIVMNRDKYYKLYEIVAISKTPALEMSEIIQTVIHDAGFSMHPMGLNYFGTEIMWNLKKNEKVFKKAEKGGFYESSR